MEMTPYVGPELVVTRRPDQVLGEAALVAKAVDGLVRRRPDLVQVIGGRKHPRFELLQIVGQMFSVTARVRETRQLRDPDGWEAFADAVHVPSGQIVASGDGMCTADEANWNLRAKYEWRNGKRERAGDESVTSHQRRSMAQTRACSRALRLALGWVLGLAGYEASAAEELGSPESESAPAPAVRRKSQAKPEPEPAEQITKGEAQALWAAARQQGLADEAVGKILAGFGYRRSADIVRADLPRIIAEIEAPAAPPAGEDESEQARRQR